MRSKCWRRLLCHVTGSVRSSVRCARGGGGQNHIEWVWNLLTTDTQTHTHTHPRMSFGSAALACEQRAASKRWPRTKTRSFRPADDRGCYHTLYTRSTVHTCKYMRIMLCVPNVCVCVCVRRAAFGSFWRDCTTASAAAAPLNGTSTRFWQRAKWVNR